MSALKLDNHNVKRTLNGTYKNHQIVPTERKLKKFFGRISDRTLTSRKHFESVAGKLKKKSQNSQELACLR